ncbi:MAG: hypothetical protein LQ342_008495 [Letrouitia transgressa]|nr:MAG: hypothetical protein LQ342_008495 [Letrouitia transgressa]
MQIPSLSLSFLLLAFLSLKVASYDRRYDAYIPNSNLLLRLIERRTETIPRVGLYRLLIRVHEAIQDGIKYHGGSNAAIAEDHLWVPITDGITFTFENINAQPMLKATYQDAQLMVEQLENGLKHLDYHECTFRLLLVSEGRGKRKKAIAVGSIYLVPNAKRAELNIGAGEIE